MTPPNLIEHFASLPPSERALIATLALLGASPNRSRLIAYLRQANIKSAQGKELTNVSIEPVLNDLIRLGFVNVTSRGDFISAPTLVATAIKKAITNDIFFSLCEAVNTLDQVDLSDRFNHLRDYQHGIVLLRLAMFRRRPEGEVRQYLQACAYFSDFQRSHPYVEICARPFDKDLLDLLHPLVQEEVMPELLLDSQKHLQADKSLSEYAQNLLSAPGVRSPRFISTLAEHWLLCGQPDKTTALLVSREDGMAQALRSAVLFLRGKYVEATLGLDNALKLSRQQSGKRNAVFGGPCGFFYVLALLRSDDPKLKKKAQTYLDLAMRLSGSNESAFGSLNHLNLVNAGVHQAGDTRHLAAPLGPLAQLFSHMVDHWLGVPHSDKNAQMLVELNQQAEAAGYYFVAAEAAELLGRSTCSADYLERAAALRKKQSLVSLVDFFVRQEPWQRQLTALAKLSLSVGAVGAVVGSQSRLVWELHFIKDDVYVAPREQKRKGSGAWSGGRAVALRRLKEDANIMDFLTPQDQQVCTCIRKPYVTYYGGDDYEIDGKKALTYLIGHPGVFWQEPSGVRVEILRGEPELEIKKTDADTLTLCLTPSMDDKANNVLIVKETPTRLRVIELSEEHRRIAAILGKGLKVPARAKEQVLDAIRSISSLITIHSDVDVLPSNLEQVKSDSRLHVHLLPHHEGLKLSILVRPFASDGPYYAPGAGSESVIAEIGKKPLQARRNLAKEAKAVTQLIAACPALLSAGDEHGERIIEDPMDCLELLMQLQTQAQAERVVIAWPEGEKFKVSHEVGTSRFSMSIKRNLDWFAASGELKIDDDRVIDLQKLLELTAQSKGRFIPLGDHQFLALTDEFRHRLNELRAFSDSHGKGVRVHRLAAAALEDLADAAGKLKADKHWKDHLVRLRELETLQPTLPGTLQAELRDYQLSGFVWLSRLAHWGVGACLADDMGLGKTLQALALLLSRAPQGPALVVAPTSVCMNWLSEIARFAPTLNVILFGAGDRQLTLAELKPFDLVVASYGLLQQESELFGTVNWHTIVLDEAQAIKNFQTKRSQAAMALLGDFRMICTGTPLENHLGELWNLFRFVNPGLLGSLEHFNERFAGPIERLQDAGVRNRLRKLIQPFMLRRTKSQVLSELPSRTEILRQVELSTEESALYEALRREALDRLSNLETNAGHRHIQILAEIMKLRRACCNPQLVAPALGLPSSKLAAFGELLDELLDNRHKALVFSQFVDHLSLIRNFLDAKGVRYQYLDGSTPMLERQVRVNAFQAGDGDVFLISLKAGGTGLNLTAADYVIHMDPWWNPAVEDQASDRAHRIGQTRPVTIYRLVAKLTIEEKIVDLHKHKRALADSLLEGSDMAAKMSADDMLQLLQEELSSNE